MVSCQIIYVHVMQLPHISNKKDFTYEISSLTPKPGFQKGKRPQIRLSAQSFATVKIVGIKNTYI